MLQGAQTLHASFSSVTRPFDPSSLTGALLYAALFFAAAAIVARAIRTSVKRLLSHADHTLVDRTGVEFVTQLAQVLVYLCALVLYAHLVPVLRQFGTALLAGVSVASVVIGLAAQNTLGNVIPGSRCSCTGRFESEIGCRSPRHPGSQRGRSKR